MVPSSEGVTAEFLGDSPVVQEARALIERAAATSVTVLIRGETGTGKELAARALHRLGPRSAGPFVKIDCTGLPENLLESELFGFEKGAFTGAVSKKQGRVELANGGTLFLDEIGELDEPLQAKLLSLLQDRQITRLGGTEPIPVDVRVVAATHRDLETMVGRNEFRQDLFYRLNVFPIWLPPLRARRDDIDALAKRFAEEGSRRHGRNVQLDEGALRLLRRQRWPGNVRQLENLVERLVVLATGQFIDAGLVETALRSPAAFETQPESTIARRQGPVPEEPGRGSSGGLDAELRAAERRAVERALAEAGGNRTKAARILGVSRSHLYALIDEHSLS